MNSLANIKTPNFHSQPPDTVLTLLILKNRKILIETKKVLDRYGSTQQQHLTTSQISLLQIHKQTQKTNQIYENLFLNELGRGGYIREGSNSQNQSRDTVLIPPYTYTYTYTFTFLSSTI